ncbi:hypothetical protein HOY80DRAFT_1044390 [Tuber brumale]|nr:hypothetical protein HOY80DRAFT_1044390 [Tuber brumale]
MHVVRNSGVNGPCSSVQRVLGYCSPTLASSQGADWVADAVDLVVVVSSPGPERNVAEHIAEGVNSASSGQWGVADGDGSHWSIVCDLRPSSGKKRKNKK